MNRLVLCLLVTVFVLPACASTSYNVVEHPWHFFGDYQSPKMQYCVDHYSDSPEDFVVCGESTSQDLLDGYAILEEQRRAYQKQKDAAGNEKTKLKFHRAAFLADQASKLTLDAFDDFFMYRSASSQRMRLKLLRDTLIAYRAFRLREQLI